MREVVAVRRGTNPALAVHAVIHFAVTNIQPIGISPLCFIPKIAKYALRRGVVYRVTARIKHPVFVAAFCKTATVKRPGIAEKASTAAHRGFPAVDVVFARGFVIGTLDELLYLLVLGHFVWSRRAER